ncbi:MAG: class I SAM-dependent methyltransferase [Acidobacteriota bacterium]|jgi:SAM-dependent methyltransferase
MSVPKNQPEFDAYAKNYEELLDDPIRNVFAGGSDFFHRRKWDLLEEFARRHKIALDGVRWLDVGCGKGELLHFGCRRVKSATGCDPSREMLIESAEVSIVHQENPGKLPFADASFDWVSAVCVYHHIPVEARASFCREAARVLKPGGYCIIIEHNPWNPATRLIVSRTPVDQDAILLGAAESVWLQQQSGLKKVEVRYFLFFPESIYNKIPGWEEWMSAIPLGGQYMAVSRKSSA